jgi:hypothetical protein
MNNEPKWVILLNNNTLARDDDGYVMQWDDEYSATEYAHAMFYPEYKFEVKNM